MYHLRFCGYDLTSVNPEGSDPFSFSGKNAGKEATMTPEQVMRNPPRILTQKQRQSYFDKGFLLVESLIGQEWIERLVNGAKKPDKKG